MCIQYEWENYVREINIVRLLGWRDRLQERCSFPWASERKARTFRRVSLEWIEKGRGLGSDWWKGRGGGWRNNKQALAPVELIINLISYLQYTYVIISSPKLTNTHILWSRPPADTITKTVAYFCFVSATSQPSLFPIVLHKLQNFIFSPKWSSCSCSHYKGCRQYLGPWQCDLRIWISLLTSCTV